MSASATSQEKSSATDFVSFFQDPSEVASQNMRWYKGLDFSRRLRHHVALLQNSSLPYNVRRGHRNKAMSMISKLAKRANQPVELIFFTLKLSRGDLKVSKNK